MGVPKGYISNHKFWDHMPRWTRGIRWTPPEHRLSGEILFVWLSSKPGYKILVVGREETDSIKKLFIKVNSAISEGYNDYLYRSITSPYYEIMGNNNNRIRMINIDDQNIRLCGQEADIIFVVDEDKMTEENIKYIKEYNTNITILESEIIGE